MSKDRGTAANSGVVLTESNETARTAWWPAGANLTLMRIRPIEQRGSLGELLDRIALVGRDFQSDTSVIS
jgi:hypothetical protein